MTIKLSLNLPALERLLGGETELEVELRTQIVAEFVKRHLKAVAESETVKAATNETTRAIHEIAAQEIADRVGRVVQTQYTYRWTPVGEVSARVKEIIESEVTKCVEEKITEYIKNRITYYETSWASHIDQRVKSAFGANIDKLVNDEIARRLKLAAEIKPAEGKT